MIKLTPEAGKLRAYIFENKSIGLLPTLFFEAQIPVAPFEYEGEEQETSVILDSIIFNVSDWRQLSGKTFTFPRNPAVGYIDGSMYLLNAHHPVDATRIRLGEFANGSVLADIDFEIDFAHEGLDELGKITQAWQVTLTYDPKNLDDIFNQAKTAGLFPKAKPWWQVW